MRRGQEAVPAEALDFCTQVADRLFPVAYSLTGNRHDAADLVQETIVAVLVHWDKVRVATQRHAYVRRMLLHTFLSGVRHRGRREVVSSEPPSDAKGGVDPADVATANVDLWRGLGQLAPRSRAVVVLRYLEDLPDAVIAEEVGTTVGNVRVIAHRALALLRSDLSLEPPARSPSS